MSSSLVGKDLDAWCNRCKLELAHVVEAMKNGVPVRVQCKTCRDAHAYRQGPPGTKKGRIKRPPRKSDFDLAMEGRDVEQAVPYGMDMTFQKDDIIKHKKLGIGLVTRTFGTTKMDVLFAEGAKILVHNR